MASGCLPCPPFPLTAEEAVDWVWVADWAEHLVLGMCVQEG